MKTIFIMFGSLFILGLAAFNARATLLLQENFAYSDGSLTNVSGNAWVTFSGNSSGVPVSGEKLYIGQPSPTTCTGFWPASLTPRPIQRTFFM